MKFLCLKKIFKIILNIIRIRYEVHSNMVSDPAIIANLHCKRLEFNGTRDWKAKKFMSCVLIDFSRAFDAVPTFLLTEKVSTFGINGSLLKFIEHFLTN